MTTLNLTFTEVTENSINDFKLGVNQVVFITKEGKLLAGTFTKSDSYIKLDENKNEITYEDGVFLNAHEWRDCSELGGEVYFFSEIEKYAILG